MTHDAYGYGRNNPIAFTDPSGLEAGSWLGGGAEYWAWTATKDLSPVEVTVLYATDLNMRNLIGEGNGEQGSMAHELSKALANKTGNDLALSSWATTLISEAASAAAVIPISAAAKFLGRIGGRLSQREVQAEVTAEVEVAESTITKRYERPSGATTRAQRASVQGEPCVDCGDISAVQVADHKYPLVKEYYETGRIDTTRMRSLESVQPQCTVCSARQGASMARYPTAMRKLHGVE